MRFASWTMPSRGCRVRAFKERKIIFAARVRVGSSPYIYRSVVDKQKIRSCVKQKKSVRIVTVIILKKQHLFADVKH